MEKWDTILHGASAMSQSVQRLSRRHRNHIERPGFSDPRLAFLPNDGFFRTNTMASIAALYSLNFMAGRSRSDGDIGVTGGSDSPGHVSGKSCWVRNGPTLPCDSTGLRCMTRATRGPASRAARQMLKLRVADGLTMVR